MSGSVAHRLSGFEERNEVVPFLTPERLIDALMVKPAHIKGVVRTVGISVNDAVRLDFTGDNGHQRLCAGVVHNGGVDLAMTFENAKEGELTSRSPATRQTLNWKTPDEVLSKDIQKFYKTVALDS